MTTILDIWRIRAIRYPYRCSECDHDFEVIKSVKQIDLPEPCEKCGSLSTNRYISRTFFYGAKVEEPEYNPGLGCIVKNRKHRDQIAKSRGLVELGNEDCEKIMDSQERKANAILEESTKPAYDALEHGIKTEILAKR